MLKAIIFDMDGVLVNSDKYVFQAYNVLLKSYGARLSEQDYSRYLGRPLNDFLSLLRQEYGVDVGSPSEFSRKLLDIELKLMQSELTPKRNLTAFLRAAKREGVKLAVATSSPSYRAKLFLNRLGIEELFDAVVAAENVDKHKPHPDVFLKASQKIDAMPGDCVVVEDASNGVAAAKAAGMKVVGLINAFHSREELSEADLLINSLDELNLVALQSLFNP